MALPGAPERCSPRARPPHCFLSVSTRPAWVSWEPSPASTDAPACQAEQAYVLLHPRAMLGDSDCGYSNVSFGVQVAGTPLELGETWERSEARGHQHRAPQGQETRKQGCLGRAWPLALL